MLLETLLKISRHFQIALALRKNTLDKINVIYRWPSFAEASEGILLRAITMPNPAKRISAKQDAGARKPERSTETFRERFRRVVQIGVGDRLENAPRVSAIHDHPKERDRTYPEVVAINLPDA